MAQDFDIATFLQLQHGETTIYINRVWPEVEKSEFTMYRVVTEDGSQQEIGKVEWMRMEHFRRKFPDFRDEVYEQIRIRL